MAASRQSTATGAVPAPSPALAVPPSPMSDLREDVHPLGEALKARAGDVLALTEERSRGRAEDVDPIIRDRFERINRGATMAVARWIAGEGAEVAIEAGRDTWLIYGELAAHRAASLNQLTKRCVWWRDSVVQVLAGERHGAGGLTRGARAGADDRPAEPRVQPREKSPSASTPSASEPTQSSRGARRSSRSWRPTTR